MTGAATARLATAVAAAALSGCVAVGGTVTTARWDGEAVSGRTRGVAVGLPCVPGACGPEDRALATD